MDDSQGEWVARMMEVWSQKSKVFHSEVWSLKSDFSVNDREWGSEWNDGYQGTDTQKWAGDWDWSVIRKWSSSWLVSSEWDEPDDDLFWSPRWFVGSSFFFFWSFVQRMAVEFIMMDTMFPTILRTDHTTTRTRITRFQPNNQTSLFLPILFFLLSTY